MHLKCREDYTISRVISPSLDHARLEHQGSTKIRRLDQILLDRIKRNLLQFIGKRFSAVCTPTEGDIPGLG
jgi:hypothetical protein